MNQMEWEAAVGLAILLSGMAFWLFARQRSGSFSGAEPDPNTWSLYAHGKGLNLVPTRENPRMTGLIEGVHVSVEAQWRPADVRLRIMQARRKEPIQRWIASTSFRVAIPARMPEGLHIRRRRPLDFLIDRLINGASVSTGDRELDADWVVHCDDPSELLLFFASPTVRAAMKVLGQVHGDVTMDDGSIRVDTPDWIPSGVEIDNKLERMLAVSAALREVAPKHAALPEPQPVQTIHEAITEASRVDPQPVRAEATRSGMRPPLGGMLRRASAAGSFTTQTGKDMLSKLSDQPCQVDVEVEVVETASTLKGLGAVEIRGLMIGWTSRIEAIIPPGDAAESARRVAPGHRIRLEGFVDNFEVIRDRVSVTVDRPVRWLAGQTVTDEPPAASFGALSLDPGVGLAEVALASQDIADVLGALALGHTARERALLGAKGRTWTVRLRVIRYIKVPEYRRSLAHQQGSTVLAEIGAHKAEVHLLTRSTPEGESRDAEVQLSAWSDLDGHSVLHEIPTTSPTRA